MKKGLASVWARAWRALTCSDIVVCCWTLSVSWLGYSKPSPSPSGGEYSERGCVRDEGCLGMVYWGRGNKEDA